jgi:hypothetical protein
MGFLFCGTGFEFRSLGFHACKVGILYLEPHLIYIYIYIYIYFFFFAMVILEMGSHKLLLPISDSQVVRITGVSHRQLAGLFFCFVLFCFVCSTGA